MSSLSMCNKIHRQLKEAGPANWPLKIRGHYEEPHLANKLGRTLAEYLLSEDPAGLRPLVIVAIGTDRSTGDSLGPLVGTKLQQMNMETNVFGTLEQPVHAVNLEETLESICSQYSNPLVIAVDACLGRTESVGYITLARGTLQPGAGVNKKLAWCRKCPFYGYCQYWRIYGILCPPKHDYIWCGKCPTSLLLLFIKVFFCFAISSRRKRSLTLLPAIKARAFWAGPFRQKC